ncbi:hypothetical protein Syun_027762 [Stephania yunnanensis]|uniref:Uncharacterized protein n=1 Tax=Stephania yunnanensis TaxID=152371 RepID=A0AAP0HQI4_9MAGN
MVPITLSDWRQLKGYNKKRIWKFIEERFVIPDKTSREKHILQRIGRFFGAWKSRLTKELENGNDEKSATINEKLWKEFKKQRRSSNFREQNNKAKEIRAKQTIQHTTCREGYARLEYEKIEEKDGASVSRAEVWIRGYSDKNGKPYNTKIAEIVDKINACNQSQCSESTAQSINNDPISQVFGTEHQGRVRGLGFGVTPTSVGATTHNNPIIKELMGLREKYEDLYSYVYNQHK